jgi:hypothetical protein
MNNEDQQQPNFFESIFGIILGFFETGLGFLQILLGFIIIRFYYAIPLWLIWSFIVVSYISVPKLNFVEVWAILIGFDCIRFDVTKIVDLK